MVLFLNMFSHLFIVTLVNAIYYPYYCLMQLDYEKISHFEVDAISSKFRLSVEEWYGSDNTQPWRGIMIKSLEMGRLKEITAVTHTLERHNLSAHLNK